MNKLIKQQILADYKELLSSEAGKRTLGGIFYAAGLNEPGGWVPEAAAYRAGRRGLGLMSANTLREANPFGVANCEVAYQNMIETYERSEEDGGDEWDAGGTD
mgnify:CR=1 FL=1